MQGRVNYDGNGGYGYRGGPSYPQDAGGLTSVVSQNPSIKTPSFNTIGLFLLAYILMLVPVNYFVLKKKKRLELAWWPGVVLCASGYAMTTCEG